MRHFVFVFAALFVGCGTQPQPESAQAAPAAAITVTSKSLEAIAHYKKGEALLDNIRFAEANEEFAAALRLDPGFALAQAAHGGTTPGPDGLKELEAAAEAAKNLPEAERLLIDGMLAVRRGEGGTAIKAFRGITEAAPGDSRGHYLLGGALQSQQNFSEAFASLKKATELNGNNGGAQNMLGYVALRQGDTDGAIAAFNEYVRILPQEPNPQDSLGEALLAAGRFKEAEAAFQKALDLSPQFWSAHEGIAFTRFYAGDISGGRDAMMKAKAAATRRIDKIQLDLEMSAYAMAQNNTAETLQILDGAAKTADAQPGDIAFVPVFRAQALLLANRARAALAPIAEAIEGANSGQFSAALSRNLRRQALRLRAVAEAQLGDSAAAQKTSAALDQEAASRADDPDAQTSMHFGRGLFAVAAGDLPTARSHFKQCSVEDEWCRWEAVVTAEKAGDKSGASALRQDLLKLYRRDPSHLIIRARLTQKGTN
jgi:Flp pilus assembly protein TadD